MKYNKKGCFGKEIDAKLCPKRDGIPSPACRNQMAEPSPGIISRNRRFSRFFVVFCQLLRANVGSQAPKPMALLIPASKFILSENTVISLKNRTKADLRQRDLSLALRWHTGGYFIYCGDRFLYIERTYKRLTRRLLGDQCNNAVLYALTMLQSSLKSLSEVDNISP